MRWSSIVEGAPSLRLVKDAISEARGEDNSFSAMQRLAETLAEELEWTQIAGINTPQQYQDVEVVRRGTVRIARTDCPYVFDVFSRYLQLRAEAGYDYD